ncbi:MAG: efflux RND transporter periplasmic adaptor subunit [Acidobacteria bacterium]|nr:efflux RND transporter periplasmic adaptor subunit [Acidobacteriota bacterium]
MPRRVRVPSLLAAAALAAWGAPARAEEFECLVQPYADVKISSAVPGILDEVRVDRGDVVTKGQPLAYLKSDVERANIDLARAKAAFAARKVERNKTLYKKQMLSSHDKDELETELEILKLEVREAEERLKLRTIVSPIDGVVVKRHYSPGEFVEEKPILEVAQIDPLRIEVVVPFKLFGVIRVGSSAKVSWEAPILGSYAATVKVVDPVVDPASGTIGVRLELPNPRGSLPAGTKCTTRFALPGDRPSSN